MARRKKSDSVKVNFKGVESRKTPAEGDYLVEVLEAKAGQSANKNDQIEFILEITQGEYKGVKLWFYCTLDEKSLWKLHAFLTALGVDVPDEEMDLDLSELVGEKCVAVVTHETYMGKKRAKMTDFDSVDNYKGEEEDEEEDEKPKKGKKSKKAKDEEDEEEEAPKKSKKSKKPAKDEDEEEEETPKKSSKKDKAKSKKKKTYTEEDIEDMDEDELQAVIDEHDLDVDLDDYKKLSKKAAAVVEALEEEDLIEE